MKRITFAVEQKQTREPVTLPDGTLEEAEEIRFSYPMVIESPDSVFEQNYALAQSLAYNGEITVEDIPDPKTHPTQEEDTAAMLVDHEFRLTLLELGLNE